MLSTTIIIHGNLQYAEIDPKFIPKVIEKSYRPVLNGFLSLRRGKVLLNFTGVTLEILAKDFPEIIQIIQKGLKRGIFELLGSAYGHPILPLVSDKEIDLHISKHLGLLKTLFNIDKPKGFWSPELAWDNRLFPMLQKYNFLWTPIDYHLIQRSEGKKIVNFNKLMIDWNDERQRRTFRLKIENAVSIICRFRRDLSDLDFQPRIIDHKLGKKNPFYIIPIKQAWSPYYTYITVLLPWLTLQRRFLKLARVALQQSIFVPFASDLELIGYGGYMKFPLTVNKFVGFIKKLAMSKEILMGSPTDFLENKIKYPAVNLKTGSWSPEGDFSLWTKGESNRKLTAICKRVRNLIPGISDQKKIDNIYEALLLAEGADGRGWAPIQIRKDFVLKQAKKALSIAKDTII